MARVTWVLAATTLGQVLSPEQMNAMSDAGFQWGEYLGVEAPWEQLQPPPNAH